jgi:2-C-methyl-D-erythritol 4-phosphate cytidylyltransferase
MQKKAVIVAGGNGLRMGAFIPKQFLLLKGKPLIVYTIETFLNAYSDMEIILVLPEEHLERGEAIVATINDKERITLTKGGATRFHSVQNGLKLIKDEAIVFVHDGVRCLINTTLIQSCYEQALMKGSAIPAVAATDSIRIANNENESVVADRTKVRIIQTPQTFKSSILIPAFQQNYTDAFTDEATVVEAFGEPVFLIEGDYNNIKVTRPVDLVIAETILQEL